MNIVACSITSKKRKEDTILYGSFDKIKDIELSITTNNTEIGLSEYYNTCIKKYKDSDIIVFIHDDVDIINTDLKYQLELAHRHYDVVGVAGCLNPKIIDQNLWHWMGGGRENTANLRGAAGHPISDNSFYITSFGPTPSRVVIIDGVLMSVNVKKLIASGSRFDEQFKFHHYDIDFSLTCNKNKLRIGVWPILINHRSPGLKSFNEKFDESNTRFLNKWKNK